MRALIYSRVSTSMQEESASLEFQVQKCKEFCKFKEYKIVDVITDVDSGRKDTREGFQKLCSEVDKDSFDILVVYETSRVSRKMITLLNFVIKLNEYKIKFSSISQPELDTTSDAGMLFFQIIASLAEYERKQISARSKSNKWARVKVGMWQGGRIPYGYLLTEKGLKPCPVQAPKVKEIFEEFIEIRVLNKISVKWDIHRNSLRKILRNSLYIGKLEYGKTTTDVNTGKLIFNKDYQIYEGKHQAIVSREVFDQAQKLLDIRHVDSSKYYTYLFSGLIICPKCGSNKIGGGGLNGITRYYSCRSCRKALRTEDTEKGILKALETMTELSSLNDIETEDQDNSSKEIIEKNRKELKNIERERGKLIKLYTTEMISGDEFNKSASILSERKHNSQSIIESLQASADKTTRSKHQENNFEILKEVIKNMNIDDRGEMRLLFKMMIDKIIINGSEYKIILK